MHVLSADAGADVALNGRRADGTAWPPLASTAQCSDCEAPLAPPAAGDDGHPPAARLPGGAAPPGLVVLVEPVAGVPTVQIRAEPIRLLGATRWGHARGPGAVVLPSYVPVGVVAGDVCARVLTVYQGTVRAADVPCGGSFGFSQTVDARKHMRAI